VPTIGIFGGNIVVENAAVFLYLVFVHHCQQRCWQLPGPAVCIPQAVNGVALMTQRHNTAYKKGLQRFLTRDALLSF